MFSTLVPVAGFLAALLLLWSGAYLAASFVPFLKDKVAGNRGRHKVLATSAAATLAASVILTQSGLVAPPEGPADPTPEQVRAQAEEKKREEQEERARFAEEKKAEEADYKRRVAEERAAAKRPQPSTKSAFDAYYMAKQFVTKELKSPSSANFASFNESKVADKGGDNFVVRTHVDSQNGFGATIRSEVVVQLHFDPGSDNWIADDTAIL